MKQYDSLKLEAARLERDAQRVNLENAVIEGERLKKEAAILDVELDTVGSFFTHSWPYERNFFSHVSTDKVMMFIVCFQ